jgi:hypothetical protein
VHTWVFRFFVFTWSKIKRKNMRSYLSLAVLTLFTAVLLFSCSGNSLEERCGPNWSPAVELEKEINDLNAAIEAYSQNPTTATCEAYKQAYLDYLDALREWEDCYVYAYSRDEFNQIIDSAEEAINQLDCD